MNPLVKPESKKLTNSFANNEDIFEKNLRFLLTIAKSCDIV